LALAHASEVVWRCTSGTNRRLRVGEESLTDIALLIAENWSSGEITCHKFNRMAEHGTSGADWLWFFRQGNRRFSVLIQAKKLNMDGRPGYTELKKHTRGRTQMWRLIDYATRERHYPLYCFYNSWERQPSWAFGDPWEWGCAVAPATRVRDHMKTKAGRGNRLGTVGPLSRPWTILVCPASSQRGPLPDRVRTTIQALWDVPDDELPPVQEGDHPMMRRIIEPMAAEGMRADGPESPMNLAGIVVVTALD